MLLQLRDDELEWREIDEEIVVLDARAAAYLAVSGAGRLIWRLLARGADRPALERALVDTYGIESERAAADVEEFLALLAARELLAA